MTFAFHEFQLVEKGADVTDIFPVITDEDVSDLQTPLLADVVRLHLLHYHPRVHGVPVHIEEHRRCFSSQVIVCVVFRGVSIDELHEAILGIEILLVCDLAALIVGPSHLGVSLLVQHIGTVEANICLLDELAFAVVLREDLSIAICV